MMIRFDVKVEPIEYFSKGCLLTHFAVIEGQCTFLSTLDEGQLWIFHTRCNLLFDFSAWHPWMCVHHTKPLIFAADFDSKTLHFSRFFKRSAIYFIHSLVAQTIIAHMYTLYLSSQVKGPASSKRTSFSHSVLAGKRNKFSSEFLSTLYCYIVKFLAMNFYYAITDRVSCFYMSLAAFYTYLKLNKPF